ncbi:MAG: hypothetical protein J2P15_23545, partial [Micromonosporaceae bacterium]|nr:hypothetical protein [Micromonosporaceae bacterium]
GPVGPRSGTVYGQSGPDGRRRYKGRLVRLRIGSHTASRAALPAMAFTPLPSGLLLGVDRDQRPVPVRFFRAEPTRITLIGGEWAGQILAFRAMALGARVVVVTVSPGPWHGFGERAAGRGERLVVVPPQQPVRLAATAARPALVIYDLGTSAPPAPVPLGPWQTQLTVLRELTADGTSAVQEGNLVMLQRLYPVEAQVAASVLRLTPQTASLLQMLEPDMVALLGGGADRYVWLSPTRVERTHAGAPRR